MTRPRAWRARLLDQHRPPGVPRAHVEHQRHGPWRHGDPAGLSVRLLRLVIGAPPSVTPAFSAESVASWWPCAPSGSIRSRSSRRAPPPASRARWPSAWRRWPQGARKYRPRCRTRRRLLEPLPVLDVRRGCRADAEARRHGRLHGSAGEPARQSRAIRAAGSRAVAGDGQGRQASDITRGVGLEPIA